MAVFTILRNTYWQTVVSIVITIQVVNLSAEAVHPTQNFEDLTINEIETCVEFVLEVVLGYDNAIKETPDHDQASGNPGCHHILFISATTPSGVCSHINTAVVYTQIRRLDHLNSGFLMTFYPPPKFV